MNNRQFHLFSKSPWLSQLNKQKANAPSKHHCVSTTAKWFTDLVSGPSKFQAEVFTPAQWITHGRKKTVSVSVGMDFKYWQWRISWDMYQINWLPGFLSINSTKSYDKENILEIEHHPRLKSCKGIPKRNNPLPNLLAGLFSVLLGKWGVEGWSLVKSIIKTLDSIWWF